MKNSTLNTLKKVINVISIIYMIFMVFFIFAILPRMMNEGSLGLISALISSTILVSIAILLFHFDMKLAGITNIKCNRCPYFEYSYLEGYYICSKTDITLKYIRSNKELKKICPFETENKKDGGKQWERYFLQS